MVPNFNGGAYAPVTPNNGNPNTVYNTEQTPQRPAVAPMFSNAYQPNNPSVPMFVNNQNRSPLSITLDRPTLPEPTLPRNTMFTDALNNMRSRLTSLESNLQPIPLPGQQPPATPPGGGNGPVLPNNPEVSVPDPGTGPVGNPVQGGIATGNMSIYPVIRENVWGDPGFSFDRNMIPVAPVGGGYGPGDGLGFRPGGSSGGTGSGGGVTMPNFAGGIGNMFRNIGNAIGNEIRGEVDSLGRDLSDPLRGIGNAFIPGLGTWLAERRDWGADGRPDIPVPDIQRTDTSLQARALLEGRAQELGNEAAAAIMAGAARTPQQQRTVEQLRQAAIAAGFPSQIETMSPQEVRQLASRIALNNMVRDSNFRNMGSTGFRSIAGGYGPSGMIQRLQGATGANGRIGSMSDEQRMEMEADQQFREYVNSQER